MSISIDFPLGPTDVHGMEKNTKPMGTLPTFFEISSFVISKINLEHLEGE